jgi:hypothetical protein
MCNEAADRAERRTTRASFEIHFKSGSQCSNDISGGEAKLPVHPDKKYSAGRAAVAFDGRLSFDYYLSERLALPRPQKAGGSKNENQSRRNSCWSCWTSNNH